MAQPKIVTPDEWEAARQALLVKEKAATRAQDALAAERRALPWVRVEKDYKFSGPGGTRSESSERGTSEEGERLNRTLSLADLFEGRRQLIVYHFMYAPGAEEGCEGCSFLIDNLGHQAHLNARDVTLAVVSDAPEPETRAFRTRMGWDAKDLAWYQADPDFNRDLGATTDEGRRPTLTVFIREGGPHSEDAVYLTYKTQDRGGEIFIGTYHYLDITPLGRQEDGLPFPQAWWRHHDKYGA
jgi:predicted dithiol-disulfide oxidoreductase (DUF899 family)